MTKTSKALFAIVGLFAILALSFTFYLPHYAEAQVDNAVSVNLNLSERVLERVLNKALGIEEQDTFGGASPEHYQKQYFYEGYQKGSVETYYASSSIAGDATFVVSELAGKTYLELTPVNGAVTLTLTGTTTSGFDGILGYETGSATEFDVYNASSTGTATITFAAGTGIDLQEDEGETVTLDNAEVATVKLIRKSDGDVIAWVKAGQVGD